MNPSSLERHMETEPDTKRAKTEGSPRPEEPEQLAKMRKENAELKRQLAEKHKECTKKDKDNAELKTQLAEKNRQLQTETVRRISVRRLIDFPPKMSLKAEGHGISRASNSKHKTASAKVGQMSLTKVPEKVLEKADMTPSQLFVLFEDNPMEKNNLDELESTYTGEAAVSRFVAAALDDARRLVQLVLGRKLCVYPEVSLFSLRPDHLVVFDEETSDPILAVEDKKPWESNGGKVVPGTVLGQVYDYLLEMRSLGHSAPVVVLSSFQESWLFWDDNNQVVNSEDKLKTLLPLTNPASPIQGADATNRFTQSPPELNSEIVEAISESVFEEIPRETMNMSEMHTPEGLVPLLYNAILCGIAQNSAAPCRSVVSNREGGYDGMALRLDRDGYEWGTLKLAEGEPVMKRGGTKSRPEMKGFDVATYFAIKTIARGATSKVFDAYDSSGNRCVVKMYVKQAEASDGELPSTEKSRKMGMDACQLEVKRLRTFYPFLTDQVHYKELHTFPCVIMPFFTPLTREDRYRSKIDRTEIKECLLKFDSPEGRWKYRECDLRWHHIGYFEGKGKGKERNMVMFDLAELEEVQEEEKFKDVVDTQIDALMERLRPREYMSP